MTLTSTSKVELLIGHDSSNDDGELFVHIGALLNLGGELRVEFVDDYTQQLETPSD